jgi:hypothetical protein
VIGRGRAGTKRPSCVHVHIRFTMHEQDPAQSSMLRICTKEIDCSGEDLYPGQPAAGSLLTGNAATGAAAGCRLHPSFQQIAGGCLHELMAGPGAATVLLQGAAESTMGATEAA